MSNIDLKRRCPCPRCGKTGALTRSGNCFPCSRIENARVAKLDAARAEEQAKRGTFGDEAHRENMLAEFNRFAREVREELGI